MAQKTIDQIATDSPFSSLTGTENVVLNQSGVTKGGAVSILKTWILSGVESDTISDATATGKALITAASASAALTTLGAQAALPAGASSDIVTGSSTTASSYTPKAIHDAVVTLAPPVTGVVKSVNGNDPDGNGNVTLTIPAALPALSQADATAGSSTTASSINALVLSTTIGNAISAIPDVTTSVHGLMTAADKTKLNGIAASANNYTLPAAASGAIGGVKQGVAVADIDSGADLPTAVTALNALLDSLRDAGVLSA